jgi:hypothetical protein
MKRKSGNPIADRYEESKGVRERCQSYEMMFSGDVSEIQACV